jgi:hypothetical protein
MCRSRTLAGIGGVYCMMVTTTINWWINRFVLELRLRLRSCSWRLHGAWFRYGIENSEDTSSTCRSQQADSQFLSLGILEWTT